MRYFLEVREQILKSSVSGISHGNCDHFEDDGSLWEVIGNIYDNPDLLGGADDEKCKFCNIKHGGIKQEKEVEKMDNTETKLTIEEVFADFQCPNKVGMALKELFDDWKRKKKDGENE